MSASRSRRRSARANHLAVAGCMSALAFVACGQAPAERVPLAAARHGGTVVAVLGTDPSVTNPDVSVGVPDLFVGCLLYDGLVRFAKGFEIVPALAKSWDISDDGLTYTLHLEEASWHDGEPFTSEDVRFTLIEVSSRYGAKFAAAGSAIERIDTPDPRTAVITLSKPFGPFLFSLACEQNGAMLPAHVLRGQDVLSHPATREQPIGIGPFRLTEWARGDHLTFERNPTYWRESEPYLDRLIVSILPNSSARLLALQAGEVDYINEYYFPLNAYRDLSQDSRFQLAEVSYPSDDLIILNTRRPPLDRVEVRQALMVALDRHYLHEVVFYGLGNVGIGPIDSRIAWAYDPAVDYEAMYPYDPDRARTLLDAAGVPVGSDGTRFALDLVFDTGRPEQVQSAQAIQRFWQAVGVRVRLEGAERAVILERVFTDYDFGGTLQTYTTSGDPALGISRLFTTDAIRPGQNFNNASRYSNPEVDELFDRGRDGYTQAERASFYHQVQRILARDLPVLTIHEQVEIDVASVRLHNLFEAANYLWWGSVWLSEP